MAGLAELLKKLRNRQITDQDSDKQHKRVVSSSHLVSKKAVEVSVFEYGLIVAFNAFGMWMVKAMSVALAEM